ncbi:serine/threonine-protein kinase [Hyalangium sp.]|uniref:serine/threonine protein kinase n=1 Tax=Hyalangium sp. TaxID=2028555 RepID=UPI002D5FD5AF|nr:serine/threonine-protein kinase [Hyalangium sp.]HYI01541.1 serine/threonine-protein kinase [Hyalangium sp.]
MSDAVVTFVDPHAPALGTTVGPWLILQRVDSGSYGVVYRAQRAGHPEAPVVALKMAKQAGDPRFEREAQLLQRVQHPSVPGYEDSGLWTSPSGARYPYVVMECVEGFILYDWFREAPRSTREVLRVLAQVARGLEAAHAEGVVHRDVKGDNIRVTAEGRAVLVDFGSGWLPGARPLTDTVAPPGTTPYRAPEMLRFMWKFRRDTEARWHARASDDLYSLGVTAYRLVTGTYPPPETEDAERRKLLRPSELATVALELEGIILRLLAEDRQERGTAREIAEALERAAKKAGPAADRAIRPTPAAAPTEEGVPRFSSRSSSSSRSNCPRPSTAPERRAVRVGFPVWLSSAIAAVVSWLIVAFAAELRRPHQPEPWIASPEEWHVPPVETPDAGVGEEVPLSVVQDPRSSSPGHVLSLPMPKEPQSGQKKPPCSPRFEREVLGVCWVVMDGRPPCGNEGYEYDGKCVRASYDAPRTPTSGQP